ncbi:hypothetical protein EG68_00491 [Paragonimus skrjabini miyazakii]|uniref:Ephrin RBD domain-containing protein n=1 Tax=Paragonimus skrjabini miyazakii TaxID=59628 RepID=A0A8S9Z419_9TREM|nr:hypothetical protein EG68_00491 [Paragonimus skrjabini miyazakii]
MIRFLILYEILWNCLLLVNSSKRTGTMFKDHVVQWNPKNRIFEHPDTALLVNEGDNLVLSCSKSFNQEVMIYWTLNQSAFMLCDTSSQSGVRWIMKCKPTGSEEDFILKISQFSELTHIPHFHPGKPVYFFAQNFLCRRMRMRLTVKLASDVSVITGARMESEKHITQEKSKPNSSHSEETAQVNQPTASSGLENYRFLLLPGSLALLTLVGMQVVICAFWIPQSLTARFKCCSNRCRKSETNNMENPDHHNKYDLHYLGNGNLTSANYETVPYIREHPTIDLFYPTRNSAALLGINYPPSTTASIYQTYNTCQYLYGQTNARHNHCGHIRWPIATRPTKHIIPCKPSSNQDVHKHKVIQVMRNESVENNCCLASDEDLIIPVKCNSPLNYEPEVRSTIRFAH